MYLTTAMLCLALNVYHESRSESLAGQHAVAQVTMNRAGRNPDNICNEVFKPNQFSWTNELRGTKGKKRAVIVAKYTPKEDKAWDMAKAIAYHTAKGHVSDFTQGATFYHTKKVKPFWRNHFEWVATIGQHKFYKYA